MEGLSASIYKRLKRYRRRKLDYQILLTNTSAGSHQRKQKKRKIAHATLGSNGRKRFWRIRIAPKLRIFHLGSLRKLLSRFREAYVKLVLRFGFSNCAGSGSGSSVVNCLNELGSVDSVRRSCDHDNRNRFPAAMMNDKKRKEKYCYEERMRAQIYGSLMAQGSLVPWCPAMIV